jgi:hypothetical protein
MDPARAIAHDSADARGQLLTAPCGHHTRGGPPEKNERPRPPRREHPIRHHVAGPRLGSSTQIRQGASARTVHAHPSLDATGAAMT